MPIKSWSETTEARLLALRAEGKSKPEIVETLTREFPQENFTFSRVKSKLQRLGKKQPEIKQEPLTVAEKVEVHRTRQTAQEAKRENRELLEEIERLRVELEAVAAIKQTPQKIVLPEVRGRRLRGVQVVQWSDWHVEERVRPETVNYLNEYSLEVAERRIALLAKNTAKFVNITASYIDVDRLIIHIGGDIISGNIHEELLENTELPPIEAILWAQKRLKAALEVVFAASSVPILVVCTMGNHTRITKKTHYSTARGNSLEYYMAHTLKDYFAHNSKVEWLIAEGYMAYVEAYGKNLRFHHGDGMQYGGGIGGIFIPVFKAISQWNKAIQAAHDFFCHFHQIKSGGIFSCNGSLIGFNAFAQRIKADFEPPMQKFSVFMSNWQVTAEHKIFVEEEQ